MDSVKMKCPICGCEEFIEIEKPYREGMDTYIADYSTYFGCKDCGLILRFNKSLVDGKLTQAFLATPEGKKWSELKSKKDAMLKNIENTNNHLSKLVKESHDENRTIKRDKQLTVEIKAVKEELKALKAQLEEIDQQLQKIKK